MQMIEPEKIEIIEALLKHAKLLRQTKNPKKAIAAAEEELRLEKELRDLIAQRDAQPNLLPA